MTRWPTTPASSLSLLAKPVGPRLAKKKSASPPRGYNSRRNDRALSNGSRPQRRFLFADRRLRLTGADAAVCSKHRGLTAPRTWKPIDVRGGQPSQTEKRARERHRGTVGGTWTETRHRCRPSPNQLLRGTRRSMSKRERKGGGSASFWHRPPMRLRRGRFPDRGITAIRGRTRTS